MSVEVGARSRFRFLDCKNEKINEKNGLKQPLIPYFISSHPGCEMQDMANLAIETKEMGFQLEQVQDFTPTPMTVSTVVYYAGVHPYTLEEISTVKDVQKKKDQNKFFFWYKHENHKWIKNALTKEGRADLIPALLQKVQKVAPNKKEVPKAKKFDKKPFDKNKKKNPNSKRHKRR